MGTHRMYLEAIPDVGAMVVVEGDEAKHAVRVKRVEPGHTVFLLDGAGAVARGTVLAPESLPEGIAARRKADWVLPIRIDHLEHAEALHPAVHVRTATPKGAHLDDMIDGLSQAGAASWAPLETERGVVNPRDSKLSRIDRVAVEASKQCGRAWVLRTEGRQRFEEAIRGEDAVGTSVVVADASGARYSRTGAADIRVLIGPEGGWAPGELDAARRAGARICSFGPHAMRIETAAVVATGVILAVEGLA